MSTERFDTVSVGKFRRTPQGGLELRARLTRTGVLEYRKADGSVVRELRHPSEVFDAESLATLKGAPITLDHPGEMVTPATYKEVAVGHVADDVGPDGNFVAATTRVQDGNAVAAIEGDRLRELSCGYRCVLVAESGEYEGQKYDMKQTQIRYNHVGLGPRGWGRAGSDVALRLDSAVSSIAPYSDAAPFMGANSVGTPAYDVGMDPKTPETPAAPPITLNVNHSDAKEVERLSGEVAALKSENERLRRDASQEVIDSKATERAELFETARSILGKDAKLSGRSTVDIQKDVVAKLDSTLDLAGKSAEYVAGAFGMATRAAAAKAVDEARSTIKTDGAPVDELEKARLENAERAKNAWKSKEPLKAVSK